MPVNPQHGKYEVTGRSTNEQGNNWEHRDYGWQVPEHNAFRYSNKDGSWYYQNPDGSKYFNDGKGHSKYTPPGGESAKGGK